MFESTDGVDALRIRGVLRVAGPGGRAVLLLVGILVSFLSSVGFAADWEVAVGADPRDPLSSVFAASKTGDAGRLVLHVMCGADSLTFVALSAGPRADWRLFRHAGVDFRFDLGAVESSWFDFGGDDGDVLTSGLTAAPPIERFLLASRVAVAATAMPVQHQSRSVSDRFNLAELGPLLSGAECRF